MRKESKERVMKEKRKKREKREEKKRKLWIIPTDKLTNRRMDRRTDGQIDTNHSLIWDTILNNIVNQIQ